MSNPNKTVGNWRRKHGFPKREMSAERRRLTDMRVKLYAEAVENPELTTDAEMMAWVDQRMNELND